VDADDLLAIGDAIIEIEMGGTYTPHRLVDMREIDDASIGYPEMARLVDRSRARALHAKLRSALLVAQPLQVGFARAGRIMDLLFGLNAGAGTTLILVTHDRSIAARCGRLVRLDAGRMVNGHA
jgi:hypothetical protein